MLAETFLFCLQINVVAGVLLGVLLIVSRSAQARRDTCNGVEKNQGQGNREATNTGFASLAGSPNSPG